MKFFFLIFTQERDFQIFCDDQGPCSIARFSSVSVPLLSCFSYTVKLYEFRNLDKCCFICCHSIIQALEAYLMLSVVIKYVKVSASNLNRLPEIEKDENFISKLQ